MNDLSFIFVIIFCAVLLAVQGAYWFITERRRSRSAVNRRLALAMQSTSARETFDTLMRERWLIGLESKYFAHFNELIIQSGLRLNGTMLIVSAFSLGVLFFMLFGFIMSYGLLAFILAVMSAIFSLFLFLIATRKKRIARFSEQLPDAIDVIVRGVKSGYPFTVAFGLVAKEMSDPIGTEFGMATDEMNFGAAAGVALDHLYHRVGHEELLYLTMAIKIQSETGGDLGEILSRLARLIREREMLRLKIKSITAEGRSSAVFLSVFPFLIFAVVSLISPSFYGSVSNSPAIVPAVIIGLFLLIVGNVIIYRMVHFKV